jgi:hypothetical protein
MTDYAVGASANDGTGGTGGSAPNTTGTILSAEINSGLSADTFGWANIDTSAIGTDTISAASIHWVHHGYTKPKAIAFSRLIYVDSTIILDTADAPGISGGWDSHDLTAGEFSLIDTSGVTAIVFDVADPGGSNYRKWDIRAWDYDGGISDAYLSITHAAAGAPPRTTILRV